MPTMKNNNINAELIEQAKGGSQRAYSKLYNLYYGMVRSTIMGIVKNYDIADDLASEVFVKVFAKIMDFKKDISFQLWLKTIAVNHSIDFIRKKENTREMHYIDDEAASEFIYTDLSNPETDMINREDAAIVREELDLYGGNMGKVIRMRFDEGLKYRQIAERMNIEIGTVKHYIHRAKQRVKKEVINNN